jgi:fatty acid desaturase
VSAQGVAIRSPGLDGSRLRAQMPDELFELPLFATFGKVLLLIAVNAALLVTIAIAESVAVMAVASAALGIAMFALAAIGHESGHLTASRNRFVNDLIGALTMSLVGMPARGWKVYHDIHHRYTGILGIDTDAQYTVAQYIALKPPQRRFIRWVNEHEFVFWPLGALLIFGINWSYALQIAAEPDRYKKRVRVWNRVDMATSLVVTAAAIAYGIAFGWLAFFFGVVVPLAIGGVMGAMTFTTNHRNRPPLTAEEGRRERAHFHVNTRTLTFPRWLPGNWFTGYVPWQIEHHLFPTVAGRNLVRVSRFVKRHAEERGVQLEYVNYFRCAVDISRTRYAWGADGRLHAFGDIDRLLAVNAEPASIPGYAPEIQAVPRRDLRDVFGLR